MSLNRTVRKKDCFGRKIQASMCSGQKWTVLCRKNWSENGDVKLQESRSGWEMLISKGQT